MIHAGEQYLHCSPAFLSTEDTDYYTEFTDLDPENLNQSVITL